MKLFFIFILFSYISLAYPKDLNNLGDTYIGFGYSLKSQLISGYPDEELVNTKSYNIKIGKELVFDSIVLYNSIGYANTTYKVKYSNFAGGIREYKNSHFFFEFNPTYRIQDFISLGPYIKGYPNSEKITETELAMNHIGINFLFHGTYNKNLNIGFFYEQTNGTTSKKVNFMGINVLVSW